MVRLEPSTDTDRSKSRDDSCGEEEHKMYENAPPGLDHDTSLFSLSLLSAVEMKRPLSLSLSLNDETITQNISRIQNDG